MAVVKCFTFNMFAENTYIVYDDTKDCIIIDPGCYDGNERKRLTHFIKQEGLNPVRLLNTHCHVDHVFGNRFVAETYNLELEAHQGEEQVLATFPMVSQMYGIPNIQQSPEIKRYLVPGEYVEFGNTKMKILFTPGHSPASVCFYIENEGHLIAGDVLFEGSIGRTDLPGGNYNTLMQSIFTELMPLPGNVKVYPGHGNATTIGRERKANPFILQEIQRGNFSLT